LTCVSKVFEKVIYDRISNFFNKHFVLYEAQYGFQHKLSTQHAILDIDTNTYDQLNQCKNAGLFCFDIKKAFNTVNHDDILLEKLKYFGTRSEGNKLLESFLKDRKQIVSIHGTQSKLLNLSCRVP